MVRRKNLQKGRCDTKEGQTRKVLAVNSGKKGQSFSRNNVTQKSGGQEGNTVEENNDYVVFKNKISTDPLGNRMLARGGGVTPPAPTSFYSRLLER